MIRFRQHIPTFVEAGEPFSYDAPNFDTLIQHPWLLRWSRDPVFYRWSQNNGHLIAEQYGGDCQWVVGYIRADGDELANVPRWEESAHAKASRDAWNRGDYPEVKRLESLLESRAGGSR